MTFKNLFNNKKGKAYALAIVSVVGVIGILGLLMGLGDQSSNTLIVPITAPSSALTGAITSTTSNYEVVSNDAPFSSTPLIAPLYPPLPYNWNDCEVSVVMFTTTRDMSELVPEPLIPMPMLTPQGPVPDVLIVFSGNCPESTLGPCGWGLIMAPVSLDGVNTIGTYIVAGYITNELYYVACRDFSGCPLKLAKIDSKEDGVKVKKKVKRGGVDIIKMSVDRKQGLSPEELFQQFQAVGFGNIINLKVVPSVTGVGADVKQITSIPFINPQVSDIMQGPATLTFGDYSDPLIHQEDPLFTEIPVDNVIGGVDFNFNFSIGVGQVLFDYLE